MAIIQISKIQLRKGASSDLPGAPTSLSPLAFEPGLDSGELAFTEDQGRLFIGHNPAYGNVNFNRTDYPYQNIEVLTENSSDFIQALLANFTRETDETGFHVATLGVASNDWASVVVPRDSDANYVYRFPVIGSIAAQIEYAVFDVANNPLRTGKIIVLHSEGSSEPNVIDSAYCLRRLEVTDPSTQAPEDVYNTVEFRFTETGPTGGRYLAFEARNYTTGALTFQFRVSRPQP